jgi:hypothetical protein
MWWDLGIMPLLLFYISNLFNYLHTGLVAQWSWQGKVYSLQSHVQDVQWAVENSRDACKLARTPHMNQKKKKSLQLFETNFDF